MTPLEKEIINIINELSSDENSTKKYKSTQVIHMFVSLLKSTEPIKEKS